jgi:hypothetical protein
MIKLLALYADAIGSINNKNINSDASLALDPRKIKLDAWNGTMLQQNKNKSVSNTGVRTLGTATNTTIATPVKINK